MSSFRMKAKSLLAHLVYHSGLFKLWLDRVPEDSFMVLMYHRIIPAAEGGPYLQPGMYVEPETFDMHLRFLKQHFEIRSINDLYETKPCDLNRKRKPACYLTFDDGWADFYQYAFPLLVKHQVPATVYLPTGFIGTGKSFWTERLSRICSQLEITGRCTEFIDFVRSKPKFDRFKLSDSLEQSLEQMITALKQFREEEIIAFLESIEITFALQFPTTQRDFLNWEEVDEMYRSGLVTFGSHTESHRILTKLKIEEVYEELHRSNDCLIKRGIVEGNRITFCYPNGGYNSIVASQVEAINFTCAFTTHGGWNGPKIFNFGLNRISIHQDNTYSQELFTYRLISIIFTMFKKRQKLVD